MAILWCGGEDIDFPNGAGTVFVSAALNARASYGRVALVNNTTTTANFLQSNAFPGGAVTSAWLTYRFNTSSFASNRILPGVGLSGTSKGLFPATDASTAGKLALIKYDGSTRTQLAAESGTSLTPAGTTHRLDMQIISYGASATVNIYFNNTLILTYTGDVTVSGMTNFDSVSIPGNYNSNNVAEFIVSDVDTQPLTGLQTLALTGAGTTNNWTNNTFSNINGTTISDTNPTSSNVNNQVQDYNVTDATAGTYVVNLVKISARMAKSSTPAVNQVQLGYNNGSGSAGAGTGATKAVTTAYATYEQYDAINPITGSAWAQSEITPLQIELTAKT